MATLAIWGEITPGAILTKCGLWGDIVDVITCAIFRDCRLRGVGVVRGVSLPSPIDLTRRPYNTGHASPLQHWSHYRVTVWYYEYYVYFFYVCLCAFVTHRPIKTLCYVRYVTLIQHGSTCLRNAGGTPLAAASCWVTDFATFLSNGKRLQYGALCYWIIT